MARVLVVDDSKLMRHFLEGAGHEVREWAEVSCILHKPLREEGLLEALAPLL
jgi:CheY-like chemotaxis protein